MAWMAPLRGAGAHRGRLSDASDLRAQVRALGAGEAGVARDGRVELAGEVLAHLPYDAAASARVSDAMRRGREAARSDRRWRGGGGEGEPRAPTFIAVSTASGVTSSSCTNSSTAEGATK